MDNPIEAKLQDSLAYFAGYIKKDNYKIVFYCKPEVREPAIYIYSKIAELLKSEKGEGRSAYIFEGEIITEGEDKK